MSLYFLCLGFLLCLGLQHNLSIIPNSHMPLKELAAEDRRLQMPKYFVLTTYHQRLDVDLV